MSEEIIEEQSERNKKKDISWVMFIRNLRVMDLVTMSNEDFYKSGYKQGYAQAMEDLKCQK